MVDIVYELTEEPAWKSCACWLAEVDISVRCTETVQGSEVQIVSSKTSTPAKDLMTAWRDAPSDDLKYDGMCRDSQGRH